MHTWDAGLSSSTCVCPRLVKTALEATDGLRTSSETLLDLPCIEAVSKGLRMHRVVYLPHKDGIYLGYLRGHASERISSKGSLFW